MTHPPLWPHQREAIAFAAARRGAMVAVGMGGGKSRIACELIRAWRPVTTLVLCPKSVVPVWTDQVATWLDGYPVRVLALDGNTVARSEATRMVRARAAAAGEPEACIVATNYEALTSDALFAALRAPWDLVIYDESQRLKASFGVWARRARAIAALSSNRLCLSGTPMPHSPLDIWSQSQLLDPATFGTSYVRFRARYAVMGVAVPAGLPPSWRRALEEMPADQRAHAVTLLETVEFRSDFRRSLRDQLQRWLESSPRLPSPFTLRQWQALGRVNAARLMRPVGWKNVPEFERALATICYRCDPDLGLEDPVHRRVPIAMGDAAREVYRGMERDLVADLKSGQVAASNVLDRLLKLQQITSGFLRDTETEVVHRVHDAKRQALADILEDLEAHEAVVVFCRFHHDLDEVAEAAKAAGRASCELSGRGNELDRWKTASSAGEGVVLAVQIQAGGLGVSMVEAAHCVYFSLGFSLGDYLQSLARVQRPGQRRRVTYHHLVVRDSIDSKVYAALDARRDVVEGILDAMQREQDGTSMDRAPQDAPATVAPLAPSRPS